MNLYKAFSANSHSGFVIYKIVKSLAYYSINLYPGSFKLRIVIPYTPGMTDCQSVFLTQSSFYFCSFLDLRLLLIPKECSGSDIYS